jgi:hypothetical protein
MAEPSKPGEPDAIKAIDVEPEPPDWLWEKRIPRKQMSVVAGKRNQGKGLLCAHIAAQVSRMRFPDGDGSRSGRVLYSAIEDSHSLMTRPRLEAAGADLDNVELWRFTLPAMMRTLESKLTETPYDLLVIDPVAAHLGRGYGRHSDNIRQVLNPLGELIEYTRTALIFVEHILKRVPQSGDALDAIGGSSSGIVAAARMAFMLGVDPGDGDRRLLCCVKNNICEKPRELAFIVDTRDVTNVAEMAFLLKDAELDFDPLRMLHIGRGGKPGRAPDKRAACAEWLTNYLYETGRPVRAGVVMEDAKQFGFSTKILRQAKEEAEVVIDPPGGGAACTWALPPELKALLDEANGVSAPELPAERSVISDEALEAFIKGERDA